MDDMVELPSPKRQRRDIQSTTERTPTASRLFAPFRTLGLVSPTKVPFTSVPLGKTTFQITTSIGTSLHTYDLRRGLNLVFLTRPQCPSPITATYAYRDRVFVAWGGSQPNGPRGVWIFKRGRLIGELEGDETHPQEIEQILVFGSWIVGCGPEAIEIWKADSHEHYTTIFSRSPSTDSRSGGSFSGQICTLPTLLNKILVGSKDGSVQVYNVTTGRLVHTIHPPSARCGSVTALAPAPALCMLAIAYADGSLNITDVEADETLLELHSRSSKKPITSITFRTDGIGAGEDGRKDGVMATCSIESGDITLWDLNRGGKVVGVLRGAHEVSSLGQGTGVNKVEFLPGQPVLVSSGMDNALKSWVFDENPFSPTPRLLHSRSGHAANITKLRFMPAASDGSDASGKWLLSAAQDRSLWGFSLRKDGQSSELSQGAVKHKARKSGLTDDTSVVEDFKAPPIIDMACSLNRDGGMGTVSGPIWANPKNVNAEEASTTGWESVLTAHADDRFARTWSWGRKKAGRWAFETGDRRPVTSVFITTCGTFAIVGSAGGSLDMFNLQSGSHRQRYPPRLTPAQAKQLKSQQAGSDQTLIVPQGHRDAVTGIVVDNLNQTMATISLDGWIIFWEFSTGKILEKKTFDSAVPTAIRYNPVSGLLALSCDDLCLRIVDIETRKTVREFWGCVGQIYDFCFSHDGRWVVACSMDSVVRIFDLATGHLIDAFKTATCTNVAFSSTGEFLATTHSGNPGVFIWTNKALFTHVPTKQIDDVKGIIHLTDKLVFQAASQLAIEDTEVEEDDLIDGLDNRSEMEQLDQALLTLSIVPQSRWQTLLNLDSIRQRNKPIQPPEKPKAAPFFLGSSNLTLGAESNKELSLNGDDKAIQETERSRISRLTSITQPDASLSQISDILEQYASDFESKENAATALSKHLGSLSPSAADLEIRSLTLGEMPVFVRALTAQLRSRKSFELVNTWMSVFLKLHGDFVSEVQDLNDAVREWREVMQDEEKRLAKLVGYTRGVVEYLRSAR